MSKLSFRARALDASKPMPIYLAEELPDLPDYSAINRAVPQMPSGMEKEEESEHHLQRAISGTGLIIPTPEVCQVSDIEFYERCYPPDYKMPKQHIHMQPLWEEQEAPEYDMDSEDERWLKQQRHPELTELKFEQMMDKLEKSSGQTVVTLNEAKLLLERNDDLVIAVYDYWLNKRLTTQHPLILCVKTEHRPGQSSNNPYLAFRRRTEKMQTRKNRKNDESSYEKMLKLRRDLARALSLLELVARRERAKRELVKLTALLADRRYAAGDFANQLLPEPPPRPAYTPVPLTSSNFKREMYTVPHYPPRPPPTPVDQPRQREKRTYKRRKHRHATAGTAHGLRDSGVYTSSEEESPRAEPAASPPDDGPFAFRRKPGCYYEMPTSTLYGDPVDPDNTTKEGLFQHEVDPRHRYTLTSLSEPYPHCIGFARRRIGRGGRVIIDRIATPLDDLWPHLPFNTPTDTQREEQLQKEIENNRHRLPKEITRDYHTSGKYPWRHAFRRHLKRHPELWIADHDDKHDVDVKLDDIDVKSVDADLKLNDLDVKLTDVDVKLSDVDVKMSDSDVNMTDSDVKMTDGDVKLSEVDVKEVKVERMDVTEQSVKSDTSLRTIGASGKRSWSDCSDSSYDSDESLYPVEREFEKFIDEVNKKWLHFRPKTPSTPPPQSVATDEFQITSETPFAVEVRTEQPSDGLDPFTTSQFTLTELYPDIGHDVDNSGNSLDISGDDLLGENFTGLTEAQMESILSETDLKALADDDDKKMSDDILGLVSEVDAKEGSIAGGRGARNAGLAKRKMDSFGSSCVSVCSGDKEPLYCAAPPPPAPPAPPPPPPTPAHTHKHTDKTQKIDRVESSPAPAAVRIAANSTLKHVNCVAAHVTVDEVADLPSVRVDNKKKKEDHVEEVRQVQVCSGVQLKTVQTKHSPLKKHIITSARPHTLHALHAQHAPHAPHSAQQAHNAHAPHIVTVAVSDTLKQHIMTSVAQRVRSEPAAASSAAQPQILTVAVSDSLKVRLQNHLLSSQSGVLVQNGPFASPVAVALPVHTREHPTVCVSAGGAGAAAAGGRRALPASTAGPAHKPVVGGKLKVVGGARALLQARHLQHLPAAAVVSLAALDKQRAGSVAQLFEIKGGALGKGAHLVNVVRPPAPRLARLDLPARLLRPLPPRPPPPPPAHHPPAPAPQDPPDRPDRTMEVT